MALIPFTTWVITITDNKGRVHARCTTADTLDNALSFARTWLKDLDWKHPGKGLTSDVTAEI